MAQTVLKTDFNFPKQKGVYKGKVREVYNIADEYLVMITSDRLSAFEWFYSKEFRLKDRF